MRSTYRTSPEPAGRGGHGEAGFTLVSVVFVVVVLAALGGALASLSLRLHMGSAGELDAVRSLQAARAGLEWAAFEVLRRPPPPAAAPGCFSPTSFAPAGIDGMTVTVTCTRTPPSGTVSDGAAELVFYQLVANACSAPGGDPCPAGGTPRPTYVERQLSWTVVR